jgi:hypothetical protein
VAYWYQTEPHAPFPLLPSREALRPPLPAVYEEARAAYFTAAREALKTLPSPEVYRIASIGELFYAGRFEETLQHLRVS